MPGVNRDVLAVIKFQFEGDNRETTCIFSRVFARNSPIQKDVFGFESSDSDEEIDHLQKFDQSVVDSDEEDSDEYTRKNSVINIGKLDTSVNVSNCLNLGDFEQKPSLTGTEIKSDNDYENSSCYHTASHTDNLSTDEHDSLKDSKNVVTQFKGLHVTDSGADLPELAHDVEYFNDLDTKWQTFWTENGEKLIWDSWITKYSAFINPSYLPQSAAVELTGSGSNTDEKPTTNLESSHFNFDENVVKDLSETQLKRQPEYSSKSALLCRFLSTSEEKLPTDVSEGWNPLSPVSIDCETEAERLLSSRCGSQTSARSFRTVDSMTNVTRISVSSLDLGSSQSSGSISSVSSVASSESLDVAEDDYEEQWNSLWKENYENEYLFQYNKFIADNQETDDHITILKDILEIKEFDSMTAASSETLTCDDLRSNEQSGKGPLHDMDSWSDTELFKNPSPLKFNSSLRANKRGSLKRKHFTDRAPLLNTEVPNSDVGSPMHLPDSLRTFKMGERCADEGETDYISSEEKEVTFYLEESEDFTIMETMGLPTSFGKRLPAMKQPCAPGASKSFSKSGRTYKVDNALNLLGVEFDQSGFSHIISGNVEYKKRHTRHQNELPKFVKPPTHIRFDKDCNVITDSSDTSSGEEKINGPLSIEAREEEKKGGNAFGGSAGIRGRRNWTRGSQGDIIEGSKCKTEERYKKLKQKIDYPPEMEANKQLRKYWARRYSLFSKFDQGIQLDEESWYSVTPEIIAKHIAEKCACDVIVDGFCGAGGNSIQFALTCKRVIAIDIDPMKIELAKNNAKVYGVSHKITFINADFFSMVDVLKADAVFLSPPWGGMSYVKEKIYDLEKMLQPVAFSSLYAAAKKISKNITAFLPKNSNNATLVHVAGPSTKMEIEQDYVHNKQIAITVFYNERVKNS